ncbi:ShlB/FhaC/HecB family hemolysin secretion/activation protein [Marinibaculum pumilum]|uniref:ShlB/FhaC/HecB family hemolysin secretion/activation protein n=1 Tax=Marinibaculum pumilum TaxID=1766165 RepID=A0ABV7KW00_9PROT
MAGTPAHAQTAPALERNLPLDLPGEGRIELDAAAPAEVSDAPIGVSLAGVRLEGLAAGRVRTGGGPAVAAPPAPGITVVDVDGVAEADLKAALGRFLGQPLSLRLIEEIKAAVVAVYRRSGRPFVSVTPPEQDISSGILRLQVLPFRAGEVVVRTGPRTAAGEGVPQLRPADPELAGDLRVTPGTLIEAPQVMEDLDWLNRYPFRQVNGVFEPGSQPGISDLNLEVSRYRPWLGYAGWSNSGTRSTGIDRYFVGFNAGFEPLQDLTIAYQLTIDSGVLRRPSSLALSDGNWPRYASHAARFTFTPFARQALEVAPNFVATRQTIEAGTFAFETTAFELPVRYISALSNLVPALAGWGDAYIGVAPKWETRSTLFSGVEVARGSAAVFDMSIGWSGVLRGLGDTAIDLQLVHNPGGIVGGNTTEDWYLYSNGVVDQARYTYLAGTMNRTTPLPVLPGLALRTTLIGQFAGQALPDIEQLAPGGVYAARGYTLSDGSLDTGLILRDTLQLPGGPVFGAAASDAGLAIDDRFSPYLFLDMASGYAFDGGPADRSGRNRTNMAGVGGGFDYSLGQFLHAGASVGLALSDAPSTRRGDVRVDGRIVVTF